MTDNVISVTELGIYAVLRVAGEDRHEFLQGQLTQDLDALSPTRSILAGWTTAKGRLLFVGQILDWKNAIHILIRSEIAEVVSRRLTMFVLRADVQIDLPELSVAGLVVDGSGSLSLGGLNVAPDPGAGAADDTVCVARVIGDPDRVWAIGGGQALDPIRQTAAEKTSGEYWSLANIRAGIAEIGQSTSETFIPQMVNLDLLDGVSFTKGCYVGQEIIARTQNLGRIKRRMYRFRSPTDASFEPGATLFGPGDATGKIVSCARDDDATELLAVLAIDSSDAAWFADEDRTRPLERQPLPYPVPAEPAQ
jgi:folate-binding protein YgfZ